MRSLYCWLFFFAAAFLAGCADINYHGETAAPTENVQFYYNRNDLPKNVYRVMGESVVTVDDNPFINLSDTVQQEIKRKAEAVGADAVVVGQLERGGSSEHKCTEQCGCHAHSKNPNQITVSATFMKRQTENRVIGTK
ncbi:MAG: hypothetical protein WC071_14315 [Victivallaceae bacterium]